MHEGRIDLTTIAARGELNVLEPKLVPVLGPAIGIEKPGKQQAGRIGPVAGQSGIAIVDVHPITAAAPGHEGFAVPEGPRLVPFHVGSRLVFVVAVDVSPQAVMADLADAGVVVGSNPCPVQKPGVSVQGE